MPLALIALARWRVREGPLRLSGVKGLGLVLIVLSLAGLLAIAESDSQRAFVDTDYICERLVPQDSFYRKFRELVTPLIKDESFDAMYCKDNGRPAISPSLLAMACILQFYRGLSDREMENAFAIARDDMGKVEQI